MEKAELTKVEKVEGLEKGSWVNDENHCCITPSSIKECEEATFATINDKVYLVQEGEYISEDLEHTYFVSINGQDYKLVEKENNK